MGITSGVLNFSEIVTVSLTLFAVIDILGSIPVILPLKKKMGEISATQATVVSGALMILFFLTGEQVLKIIGLDIHSFAIAGSIVLFILALEMILGMEFFRADKDAKTGNIVPIAFPLIAGSGTLTTIMSLKAEFQTINILIAILINLIVVFLTLRSINFIERILQPSGISVVRKFFGIILLAIAVKIFKSNVGL
jgi:multiple antibiotic resistance protein